MKFHYFFACRTQRFLSKFTLLFFLLLLTTGCGAGLIHQTTSQDYQMMPLDDAKEELNSLFYQGTTSIGFYQCSGASLTIKDDGFQVSDDRENMKTFCNWSIGDPYIDDWGIAALDSRYSVRLKGCNAEVWFQKKESALRFSQLLYTIKHLATENKHSPMNQAMQLPVPKEKTNGSEPLPAVQPADIDQLPALSVQVNQHNYAIVIGIEQYRQNLPKADFATQDARLVTEYLTKVMGYPSTNVITLLNEHASFVDLAKYLEKWLPNNISSDSTVFIYFSGHGSPDPHNGNAYLVPYDGDPSFIAETGYPLDRVYATLDRLPAKKIIIAIDSCFSGSGNRSVIAQGTRSLVAKLKMPFPSTNKITVFSASSATQTSSTYTDKGHGLFTYFFLKGIKEDHVLTPDGSVNIQALFSYLKPQVETIARKRFNSEQTPQLH